MVRDLNKDYLEPLTDVFPANRLGPTGDVAKVNCATCHQGVDKPLQWRQHARRLSGARAYQAAAGAACRGRSGCTGRRADRAI